MKQKTNLPKLVTTHKKKIRKPGLLKAKYLSKKILRVCLQILWRILNEFLFAVGFLPAIHNDPFDRLLIAQCMV